MNENGNNKTDIHHQITPQRDKRFHWRRIHHTWIFWIFLVLMLVGIMYYVVSVDFAFAPQTQIEQPTNRQQ